MIERLENGESGRWVDILTVWVPNGTVLALINLVTLNLLLTILLTSVSLAYTIWRWRRDSSTVCDACRDGKVPNICPVPVHRRPWDCPKKL